MTSCPDDPGNLLNITNYIEYDFTTAWSIKHLISKISVLVAISRFWRNRGWWLALAIGVESSSWQLWNLRKIHCSWNGECFIWTRFGTLKSGDKGSGPHIREDHWLGTLMLRMRWWLSHLLQGKPDSAMAKVIENHKNRDGCEFLKSCLGDPRSKVDIWRGSNAAHEKGGEHLSSGANAHLALAKIIRTYENNTTCDFMTSCPRNPGSMNGTPKNSKMPPQYHGTSKHLIS